MSTKPWRDDPDHEQYDQYWRAVEEARRFREEEEAERREEQRRRATVDRPRRP